MRRGVAAGLPLLLLFATAGRGEEAVPTEAADEPVHTVAAGETLWTIAEQTIGDPTLWPALYLANRDRIKDPSRVYPGQRLAIPEIEPAKRAALRREAAELLPK